jgi:hypothetical protein
VHDGVGARDLGLNCVVAPGVLRRRLRRAHGGGFPAAPRQPFGYFALARFT